MGDLPPVCVFVSLSISTRDEIRYVDVATDYDQRGVPPAIDPASPPDNSGSTELEVVSPGFRSDVDPPEDFSREATVDPPGDISRVDSLSDCRILSPC